MELTLSDGTRFLVDLEDIPKIFNQSWHIFHSRQKVYIRSWDKVKKRKVFLHRIIMGVTNSNLQVDHINGNTLDNRKENLRICSHRQNVLNREKHKNNTSGYKGVSINKNTSFPWKASIGVNKKRIYLGQFSTAEEAAKAYNEAALKYFGEYARINKL